MTGAIRSSILWRLVVVAGLLWLNPSSVSAQTPTDAQVRAELEAGAYDRAERLARDRVVALTPRLGQGAADVRSSEQLLIEALILNGRGAERGTLDLARRLAQRTPDGRPPSVQSLIHLGDALVAAAEYAEAVGILTQSQSAVQSEPNSDPGLRSTVQHHLGRAFIYNGRANEALPMLERSLSYARSQGSAGPLADSLLVVAWAQQRSGNYSAAGSALREALAIRERTPEHPGLAEVVSLLGLQLWFEGDLLAARATSQRAVEVAERTLRPDHPVLALALMRLGATLLDLGDVSESIVLKQRALAIAERAFGPAHYETWGYINSLAESRRRNGEYTASRALFLRALSLAEGRFGATHDSVATAVHNLALVDASLGDYTRARAEQVRATSTWERLLGPDHPFVAVALIELAAVYRAQGDSAEALPLLRRGLRIRTLRLGAIHRDVAKTLADLAAAYLDLGRIRDADQAITGALDIWMATAGPDTPDYAAMCDLRARIDAARGQLPDAQAFYERALTIWDASLGRQHPVYAETKSGLATVLARRGQVEAAETAAAEAEDTGRTHLRLMLRSLPERQALRYAATRPSGLGTLLSLAPASPRAAGLAYDRLVRSRSLVLDEMAFRGGTTDMSAEVSETYAQLTQLRRRLANLVVAGYAAASTPAFRSRLEGTRTEIEALETELARRSAPFRIEQGSDRVGFSEVRARLGADDVLVSFAKYVRRPFDRPAGGASTRAPSVAEWYVAFVVTAASSEPIAIPLADAARVETLVHQWRAQLLAETAAEQPATTGPSSRVLGAQLRRIIWNPLAARFTNVRRVFVVPDGALSLLPFGALPSGPGRYLIEDGPLVHVLTTERDLVADASTEALNKGLLAIGGPSFSAQAGPAPRASATAGAAAGDVRRAVSTQDGCGYRSMQFTPLPGSRMEAEQTEKLWTALHPSDADVSALLTGDSATEQAFKRLSAGHRVLHIATHGFFFDTSCDTAPAGTRAVGGLATTTPAPAARANRDKTATENPLLLSGLALAGANRRVKLTSDDDDGILTAEEVASLNLRGVEWAVLSACDTGLGTISAGEGVIGLRRAFQIAGVKTVMMSLWPVGDRTARRWTELLYRARLDAGLDSASSAWLATKQLLEQRRLARQSTNPFYWAGFVAAGDWR
jgi:CHAT domain-containing protein/tetratricopeptide (TPR) repeat protein